MRNLITENIKAKKVVTTKDWTAWKREMKKSLKPVDLSKLSSEQRRGSIRERINLAKLQITELIVANAALKSKAGKSLLKVKPQDLKKTGEEAIRQFNDAMVELAKEDARTLNWTKAIKALNDAIDFSDAKINGLTSIQPDVKLFLYRAKAQYYKDGIKPALKKGLYEALDLYPKRRGVDPDREALTHAVSRFEILDGKYDAAFNAMQQIPRNISSRTDTVIRYMLQPHTDHGGLEPLRYGGAQNKGVKPEKSRANPIFFGGSVNGGLGGIGSGFDFNPFDDFLDTLPGGSFGNIPSPLANTTTGAPLGFPCNFYTYQYTLMKQEQFQRIEDFLSETETLYNDITLRHTRYQLVLLFADIFKQWNAGLDYLHNQDYSKAIGKFENAQISIAKCLSITRGSASFDKIPELNYSDYIGAMKSILGPLYDDQNTAKFREYSSRRKEILDLGSLYNFDWEFPKEKVELPGGHSGSPYEGEINMIPLGEFLPSFVLDFLVANAAAVDGPASEIEDIVVTKIESPVIHLAILFIPFAKIEAFRFSKQYDRALKEIDQLFEFHEGWFEYQRRTNKKPKFVSGLELLNPAIEVPFLKILKAQVLMELADKQYKGGESERALTSDVNPNGLKAYRTYHDAIKVFDQWNKYKDNVNKAVLTFRDERNDRLKIGNTRNDRLQIDAEYKIANPIYLKEMEKLQSPVAPGEVLDSKRMLEARALTKSIHISNVSSSYIEGTNIRAALKPRNDYPWKRILYWDESGGENSQSNPLIYSIVLNASSMIMQIQGGFNYLGYSDDYLPPWKFNYLLDRARYYSDQAKNLQRDYLNFLTNAEQQQFQEMGAGQTVSLERMNLNVEAARIDQADAELDVAIASKELADMQALHAEAHLNIYTRFDEYADSKADQKYLGSMLSAIGNTASNAVLSGGVSVFSGAGELLSANADYHVEKQQREDEKFYLELAHREAVQSASIAGRQQIVAEKALAVATAQAQSALMRLEFAQDNYEYLRNRITHAEMWFRLAHSVREVANTYLRRAVEMSFFAEQVYEFMVDKRINVIRFDYDNDEVGAMLSADYLKADLDYLESHLIFTQREKQQQVKCVISLARDFPQALQELSENESVIFPITLEYLEHRFPGMYNIKVSAIELRPFAVMDPTRFNVELTYMGSGLIRVKSDPVNSDGSGEQTENVFVDYGAERDAAGNIVTDGAGNPLSRWILESEAEFPVKSLLRPVETAIFSGLTATEEGSFFQSFSSQQKNFFEDCPASAGWRVDMSMTENKVVSGSLADMEITFYLTGFYDEDLKTHIDEATTNETSVVTNILSARNRFSDQYFSFERTGRIEFNVTPNLLSINERIGELKQLAAYFMPALTDVNYSRISSQDITKFKINNNRTLSLVESAPRFRLRKTAGNNNKALTLTIQLSDPLNPANNDKVEVFSDENNLPVVPSVVTSRLMEADITFAKQGRHVVTVKVVQHNALSEFKMEVFVADSQPPILPNLIFPSLGYDNTTEEFLLTASRLNNSNNVADANNVMNATVLCINKEGKRMFSVSGNELSQSIDFAIEEVSLPADEYFLITAFSMPINVKFSSNQAPTETVYACEGNKLSTNKDFTTLDNSTVPSTVIPIPPNGFTTDLLSSPVSPLDQWRFDLSENGFRTCYDCNGNQMTDLSIFQDVQLILEYEVKRRH